MLNLSHFDQYVGCDFEVIANGDIIDTLTLVRTGALPAPPKEYTAVRQDPFELLFRAHSDQRIDATVTLRDKDSNEFPIYLNPECFHVCEDSGNKVTQYHCCFT